MTLLSATDVFDHADANGHLAVPCFDVAGGNADVLDAVCRNLAEQNRSAFLSSTPASIRSYLGMDHFVAAVGEVQDRFAVTVAAHLDHAEAPSDVESALDAGVRSVMFDGSLRPLDDNIRESRRLVEIAHRHGATLEAEVGVIGGKEDLDSVAQGRDAVEAEVAAFLAAVEPDLFAPAIGTIHGRRGGEATIAWESAETYGEMFPGPLVLHGTTGLPTSDVRRLIELGYRKVNYATAVRDAFVSGMRDSLNDAGDPPRPQVVLAEGRRSVSEFVGRILTDLA